MSKQWPARFGDEVLDYEWDWNPRLEDGETITDVTVTVTGSLTLDSDSTTDGVTTVWISGGGTGGGFGAVNLTAETSAGRALGEKVGLPIKSR